MIVVAVHGDDHWRDCLNTILQHKPPEQSVMLVDGEGYDTGKYVRAARRCLPEEQCLFLQDSVRIRTPEIFRGFAATPGFMPLLGFLGNQYDSAEQRAWVRGACRGDSYLVGTFGPMFFCYAGWVAAQALPPLTHKREQQGMERGWSVLAEASGVARKPLFGSIQILEQVNTVQSSFLKMFPQRM